MARKPIVDSTPDVLVTTVKDDVHTGHEAETLGYRKGVTINLTQLFGSAEEARKVADVLINLGQVIPADGSSAIKAKERGKAITEEQRQASRKRTAEIAHVVFDDMPPELRALAREHGDEVTNLYIEHLQPDGTISQADVNEIVRAYQPLN